MPYVEPEIIEQVRQIDLLTYLRKFEPDNVEEVKGTRNVYRTVDHDSLKMSNGKWFSLHDGGHPCSPSFLYSHPDMHRGRGYSSSLLLELLLGNWQKPASCHAIPVCLDFV